MYSSSAMPSLLVSRRRTQPPTALRMLSERASAICSTTVREGLLSISFCWAAMVSAMLVFTLPSVIESYRFRSTLNCTSTALAVAETLYFSNSTVTVSPRNTCSRIALSLYSSDASSCTNSTVQLTSGTPISLASMYVCALVRSCASVGFSWKLPERSSDNTRTKSNVPSTGTVFSGSVTRSVPFDQYGYTAV